MNKNKIKNILILMIIPLLFLVISIFTINDYGISWDEPLHFARGQAYLNYYLTGNKNYDNLYFSRSYYQNDGLNAEYFFENDSAHPPTNDILAAFLNYIFYQRLGIMGDIQSLHLFSILSSTLLIFVVCLFASETIGLIGAMISGIVMATYPLFFAESHFNIKDPAETTFIVLTIYLFWKSLKKFDWKPLFFAAVSAGLALGIKFNIVFIPFMILPYLIIKYWKKIPKFSKKYWIVLLLSPCIVFLVFYIFWPYLWTNTLDNLINAVKYYKEIGTGINSYQNKFVIGWVNLFPIYWIITTTPPAVLFLGIVGIFVSIFKIKTKEKTEILWLLLFLITILRVSVLKMSLYGGIRQIMEFLPGLALLSGLGFVFLLNRVKFKKFIKILLIFLLTSSLIYPLFMLHPNENVYFNSFVGGLKGAKKKNVPYWGNSFGNAYLQAAKWINNNAEVDSKVALIQGTITNIPSIWFRKDLSFSNGYWSGIDKKGEYLIELTHNDPVKVYPYVWGYVENFLETVYEVKVDDVAIAKVWKNDINHTKEGYKNEIQLSPDLFKFTSIVNMLEINLNVAKKITRISVSYISYKNCTEPKAYVEVNNLKGWVKLQEPIPSLQMEKAYQPNKFTYFFTGEYIKDVRFIFSDKNSCVFSTPKVNINILE